MWNLSPREIYMNFRHSRPRPAAVSTALGRSKRSHLRRDSESHQEAGSLPTPRRTRLSDNNYGT
eukprot:701590-Amphidinium_carterae.1